MGPEDHNEDEDQGNDDPFKEFQGTKGLAEHIDANGADNGADYGVESSEIDHCQHFCQIPDAEASRTDEAVHMGEQAARHPGPEGAEHKGGHLGFAGVDGHGVGSRLVIAHGIEGLAHDGGGEVMDDPDAEDGPDEYHGQGE